MKQKITILLAIMLSLASINQAKAQQETKSYHEKMSLMMSKLDSTKFKNNILYDKVFPLANLKHFNQEGRKDTSNYKHFSQTIYELNLLTKNNFYIDNDALDGIKFVYSKQKKCPIGIINIDFTTISDDAFDTDNSKMIVDSTNQQKVLREIQNKNPYTNKHTIIISPLVKQLTQDNQPITFMFDKLFYDLSDNEITDLQITFNNNETSTIISNGTYVNTNITHQFQEAGMKLLKFTGHFSNNQHFETYAQLKINFKDAYRPAARYGKSHVQEITSSELFTPYFSEEVRPPSYVINESTNPKMKFQVFYGANKHKLTKPIIIVDGIDYVYDGDHNNIEDDDINDIVGMFGYTRFQLNDLGFDLVIGDFPTYSIGDLVHVARIHNRTIVLDTVIGGVIRKGGADYIERNAKPFKQLVRSVNDSLLNNNVDQQIVVIGPSMGGLVTRYGLKEMENAGEDHNVRLWVSLDAPHQGANVPLAFQYLVYHLNSYSSFFDNLPGINISTMLPDNLGIGALKRPASKQMLIKHYLDDHVIGFPFAGSTNGAPFFRQRFNNALTNMGYPNNTRKIALVNGSFMGTTNNTAGSKIADVHFWMDSFPWGDILDATLHYEANSGLKEVIGFNYGSAVSSIMNINDINKYTITNSNIGSADSAPGCYFELPSVNLDYNNIDVVPGFFNIWVDGHFTMNETKLTFMPTKSTLDFQGSNKLLRENLCSSYGNLTSLGLTPFDSYYAPIENEPHVTLNQENTQWLLQEILGNPQQPFPDNSLCQSTLSIIGLKHLCPGQEETYRTNVNVQIDWTLSGLTEISRTGNQITVTKNAPNSIATISASATGYNSVTENIYCLPIFDISHHDIDIDISSPVNNLPLNAQSITDVQWELTHGTGSIVSADNRKATIESNDYYGEVTVTNESGSVTKTFFGPDPDKCYIIKKVEEDKYQVIDRCNGYQPITTMPIKEIYDKFGNKIQDAPVINDKIDVSGSGNTGDIRIIHIIVNGENVSKMIIKD